MSLMTGKVVVVSGIGPGLGVELALLAAREGAKGIVLAARTPAKLESAAEQIAALDLEVAVETLCIPTDIAKLEDCERLVKATNDRFGRIDALINSAYIPGGFGNWEKWDFADWKDTLDVNLFGSLQLSREAARVMKEQSEGGAIVMVNSMVMKKIIGAQAGYATSKGALSVATRALAEELAPYKIRVNTCYMGWMWGANVKAYVDGMAAKTNVDADVIKGGIEKQIPLGEMPTDKECAKGCMFLASDYAKVITGASLDINGGEFMPLGG